MNPLILVGLILAGGTAGSALAAPAPNKPAGILRGIYADPGPALDNRLWASYGAGYEFDAAEKHGGRASIRCVNATDREGHGAGQTIQINQEGARPIAISGWAKLEGVKGPADYHCSVYLDLALKDGTSWAMKIAAFDPAKSGWQFAEQTYTPPSPIASARVYVFLRERQGTAWFDDIGVCEVLDEKGTRGKNLLADPGLEGDAPGDTTLRDRFFGKLKEIGCNAFHFYRGVSWEKVMGDGPTPPDAIPAPDHKDPVLDFVRDAHKRGFKVWLTAGLGMPKIVNARSPEFPFWPCVNGRWGQAYTRALAYYAQFGVDGIGMVPDEWNYDTSAVSGWEKHSDPDVARFYAEIPSLCACDVCRAEFRRRTGLDYPDVKKPWSTADPVWAEFARFRYDSTAAWIRRSVAAVKRVHPKIITDTMICVLPVCSRDRLRTGAAWDQIGVETGLDMLQTDPYIQLHNYRGDSTHYYPAETTLHLAEANWKGGAGVTLESCRLYEKYCDKQPVEVYGSALSCLAHGAREFFWWYFSYLTGAVKFVDPAQPSSQLTAVYKVMREMEPALQGARAPGEVLVLYSRRSEDVWDWLGRAKALPARGEAPADPKRGFLAHRNVLHWLLRRGVPFRMTFLEHPDPARLREARVLLVPFAYALSEAEAATIEAQARAGKTVLLMSEPAPADPSGKLLPRGRLAHLVSQPGRVVPLGKGKVVSLGDSFVDGLLQALPPMKDPQAVVPLPPFAPEPTAALEKALAAALGRPAGLFAAQPEQDVEATFLAGPRGRLVLLINWDTQRSAKARIRLPVAAGTRAQGFAILRDATVKPVSSPCAGVWQVDLAPQEARLLQVSGK